MLSLFLFFQISLASTDFDFLRNEVATGVYNRQNLKLWKRILEDNNPEDLLLNAPTAILKINSSRENAKYLVSIYKKSKEKINLKYAILEALVKAKVITTMVGWQTELMADELTYDQKLVLNSSLDLRESAVKKLYFQSNLIKSYSCVYGRKKFTIEVKDPGYVWIHYSGHYFYTGLKQEALTEANLSETICPALNLQEVAGNKLVLLSSAQESTALFFETRKMRPIELKVVRENVLWSEVTKKINGKVCFVQKMLPSALVFNRSFYCN